MHREYKCIVEHSPKAILIIHGIVGTPNHFNAFVPLLPPDVSVYNILLDGHGKGVREFAQASMEKWKEQVSAAVAELSQTHEAIYIVGHSLGTLLAIEQAMKCDKITKLFLLAVPLQVSLKPRLFANSLKVYFNRIDPQNEELMAAINCCGVENAKNPLRYIGRIPRFLELFAQIRHIRKTVDALQTPTLAFQSCRDEMVSRKSKELLERNPAVSVVELENSGHYYYEKTDLALLQEAFIQHIAEVKPNESIHKS